MPTSPRLNFLEIQIEYENIAAINLTVKLNALQAALSAPVSSTSATTIEGAFTPIAEYYNKLTSLNTKLQKYISQTSNDIADLSASDERYSNRIHPEEAVLARELSRGLLPELRVRSIPYLLAISVFMASLTIFLIFQMFGFSGQVNLPPSISAWLSSPASSIPFYMNPMILGGISIILLVALVIFIILYLNSKNSNNN
jgi:hypothetical protein